jgi:hypothetical protein
MLARRHTVSVTDALITYGGIDISCQAGGSNGVRHTTRASTTSAWSGPKIICEFDSAFRVKKKKKKKRGLKYRGHSSRYMYVDTRLHRAVDLRFDMPFFERGDFPQVITNGTEQIVLQNPWIHGPNSAPFDQQFYLVLNVAVGGTNGWFPDGAGSKPWLDGSLSTYTRRRHQVAALTYSV